MSALRIRSTFWSPDIAFKHAGVGPPGGRVITVERHAAGMKNHTQRLGKKTNIQNRILQVLISGGSSSSWGGLGTSLGGGARTSGGGVKKKLGGQKQTKEGQKQDFFKNHCKRCVMLRVLTSNIKGGA